MELYSAPTRRQAALIASLLCVILAGCSSIDPAPPHPLLDRIVDAQTGSTIRDTTLLSKMATSSVVYLGEKHDNPDHHQRQLQIVEELVRRGHRPALGFEMFTISQSSALMEFVRSNKAMRTRKGHASHKGDRAALRLRATTGMDRDGDQRWQRYGPLLQLARKYELTAFGIDLPQALRRRITRVGINGLTPMERRALPADHDLWHRRHSRRKTTESGHADATPGTGTGIGIGTDVDRTYRQQMLARLKAAHCGHGSPAYLERLFQVWQARNETMARAVANTAPARGASPVVVIVGGGHVRNAQGLVPRVARHLPGSKQLIVNLVEVDETQHNAPAYLSAPAANSSVTNEEFLWFGIAQGLSVADACTAFLQHKKRS